MIFQNRVGDFGKSPYTIGIPAVVLYELATGIAKSTQPEKRQRQVAEFMAVVDILPFGAAEAPQVAQIRAALEQAGAPVGAYDVLIAATALARQDTLVTHNLAKFSRIPGLLVEDWFS
ncbi:MAG: hypothetical protein Fur0021_26040 [Candidatus Promineifilaceae bacterium]